MITQEVLPQGASNALARDVGIFAAVMMGLGSIIGTGVFVSIGIATGAAGPAVIISIVVAGIVASFNGLSTAQLTANHPVSGGTYAHGYHWLNPSVGFTAGWMFLCAKSASAATATLGLARYALEIFRQDQSRWQVPVALLAIIMVTGFVLCVDPGLVDTGGFSENSPRRSPCPQIRSVSDGRSATSLNATPST